MTDQPGAAEKIKIVDAPHHEVPAQALEEIEQLAGGDRDAGVAQTVKEVDQHAGLA
jgi:hypothetical protein